MKKEKQDKLTKQIGNLVQDCLEAGRSSAFAEMAHDDMQIAMDRVMKQVTKVQGLIDGEPKEVPEGMTFVPKKKKETIQ